MREPNLASPQRKQSGLRVALSAWASPIRPAGSAVPQGNRLDRRIASKLRSAAERRGNAALVAGLKAARTPPPLPIAHVNLYFHWDFPIFNI
jgi:hypothetical protein